jgi:hypothetical protein
MSTSREENGGNQSKGPDYDYDEDEDQSKERQEEDTGEMNRTMNQVFLKQNR